MWVMDIFVGRNNNIMFFPKKLGGLEMFLGLKFPLQTS
jgi:hypothetical protein